MGGGDSLFNVCDSFPDDALLSLQLSSRSSRFAVVDDFAISRQFPPGVVYIRSEVVSQTRMAFLWRLFIGFTGEARRRDRNQLRNLCPECRRRAVDELISASRNLHSAVK